MSRVIVVGGGVAGLVIAFDLARAGESVILLERADVVGGQVADVALGGRRLDVGAESFATRGTAVTDLLHDLGLQNSVLTPLDRPAWVVNAADGRSYPLPTAGVLGIPVHPWRSIGALGLVGAARAACDAVLPRSRFADGASVGEIVGARMGARVRDRLVDPVVRGVYSSAASDLALRTASPALARELASTRTLAGAAGRVRSASPAGSQVAGLVGGMTALVGALLRGILDNGGLVRNGCEVLEVSADGVVLRSDKGGGGPTERLDADVVVVAAPGLASTPTVQRRITVAAALVQAPGLDAAPRGTGVLVAGPSGTRARALTHSSAKWRTLGTDDGHHLVRLSYDARPDGRVPTSEEVQRDVRTLTGVADAEVRQMHTRTWVRTIATTPSVPAGQPSPVLVGEAAGVTGLAAVVENARAQATLLIHRPTTQGASS